VIKCVKHWGNSCLWWKY